MFNCSFESIGSLQVEAQHFFEKSFQVVFPNGFDNKVPSLPGLERYVKLNKHLPEVPSAKEIEKNGLDLAEMNLILLKKVEELTLHLIEKDKEIRGIKEGYESLMKRLEKMENFKK